MGIRLEPAMRVFLVVAARFAGHGPDGYRMALEFMKEHV